jgi:hypothetical protein
VETTKKNIGNEEMMPLAVCPTVRNREAHIQAMWLRFLLAPSKPDPEIVMAAVFRPSRITTRLSERPRPVLVQALRYGRQNLIGIL